MSSRKLRDQAPATRPAPGPGTPADPVLTVDDLRVVTASGVALVESVSLAAYPARTLAMLGESGSGKSLTGLALLGLLPDGVRQVAGGISLRGRDLTGLRERDWRELRGPELAMIFQDPMSSLNPVHPVGRQVAEMIRLHRPVSRRDAHERAVALMRQVRIPDADVRARDYPHQFSGGMRQRAMIAMALALTPAVLVADEPTTALDVTVQADVLDLLADLRRDMGMSLILITHDVGVAHRVADDLLVMYAGRVAESGPARQVLARPAHPYTAGLLRARPAVGQARLVPIPGQPPSPGQRPDGCPFHPRCPRATEICRTELPRPRPVAPGQVSACHHAEEVLADDVA